MFWRLIMWHARQCGISGGRMVLVLQRSLCYRGRAAPLLGWLRVPVAQQDRATVS